MALVNLYRVAWHTNGRNAANTQAQQSFVVAAPNVQDVLLASLIQAQNGDGRAVTVDHVSVEKFGVIS